jgi:hypothetical protein
MSRPAKTLEMRDKSRASKLDQSSSAAIRYGVVPPVSIRYRLGAKVTKKELTIRAGRKRCWTNS